MHVSDTAVPPSPRAPTERPGDQRLRDIARELEVSFLTVMLRTAGVGESRDAFGGGAGEEQFASFLAAENARALVDRGGLGLAESVFKALKARGGDA
jgi:Rod binding domain-containing protein